MLVPDVVGNEWQPFREKECNEYTAGYLIRRVVFVERLVGVRLIPCPMTSFWAKAFRVFPLALSNILHPAFSRRCSCHEVPHPFAQASKCPGLLSAKREIVGATSPISAAVGELIPPQELRDVRAAEVPPRGERVADHGLSDVQSPFIMRLISTLTAARNDDILQNPPLNSRVLFSASLSRCIGTHC